MIAFFGFMTFCFAGMLLLSLFVPTDSSVRATFLYGTLINLGLCILCVYTNAKKQTAKEKKEKESRNNTRQSFHVNVQVRTVSPPSSPAAPVAPPLSAAPKPKPTPPEPPRHTSTDYLHAREVANADTVEAHEAWKRAHHSGAFSTLPPSEHFDLKKHHPLASLPDEIIIEPYTDE